MTIQLENYEILYADAPFEMYNSTVCVSVNLQLCEADTYTHAFIPGGNDDAADKLVFTIVPSGDTGVAVINEMISGLTPAKSEIQVILQSGDTIIATHLLEYGEGTLHADQNTLQMPNYIAAPYKCLYPQGSPRSVYIIFNMPTYTTDTFVNTDFLPGSEDTDSLLISINSAENPNEAHIIQAVICGPYDLTNAQSMYVQLEVSVNGRQPSKSPMGKKSYGQDTYFKKSGSN